MNPNDLSVEVFIICEETIPDLIKMTGLNEAYFNDLIQWDEQRSVKAYFFPKLLPSGRPEERMTKQTIIQMRDSDISDDWSDEHIVTHMLSGTTVEEYFEKWGKNSGFEFRLIERVVETKTHERVISEKQT